MRLPDEITIVTFLDSRDPLCVSSYVRDSVDTFSTLVSAFDGKVYLLPAYMYRESPLRSSWSLEKVVKACSDTVQAGKAARFRLWVFPLDVANEVEIRVYPVPLLHGVLSIARLSKDMLPVARRLYTDEMLRRAKCDVVVLDGNEVFGMTHDLYTFLKLEEQLSKLSDTKVDLQSSSDARAFYAVSRNILSRFKDGSTGVSRLASQEEIRTFVSCCDQQLANELGPETFGALMKSAGCIDAGTRVGTENEPGSINGK